MTSHQVQLLFVDLALILVLARVLGALAVRVRQPPVVGEIVAGILLGPTLFSGAVSGALFPADIRPLLNALAQVGVALFMFLIGLELEKKVLRGSRSVAVAAAVGSTLLPFALGIGLAFYLLLGHHADHRAAFVVFIGLSVSVTAFPVLARILTDRGLSRGRLGGVALATAATVDVVAWTVLAGVQVAVGSGGGEHWRVALVVPFALVMLFLVRPLLRRLLVVDGVGVAMTPGRLAAVLIGALLSGAATEAVGMHYIFGAFLFGVVLPREGAEKLREEIVERTTPITALLLPVYFVVAGLKVDLGALGGGGLVEFAAILGVAVLGKFGGTYLGARSQGFPARHSSALAALMNTRGLTELIILGVGVEAGLLDDGLYSLMVAMALVTTAMTGPLLSLILPRTGELPDHLDPSPPPGWPWHHRSRRRREVAGRVEAG